MLYTEYTISDLSYSIICEELKMPCTSYSPMYPHRHRGPCIGLHLCRTDAPYCFGSDRPIPLCGCSRCTERKACPTYEPLLTEVDHTEYETETGMLLTFRTTTWPSCLSCDTCSHDGEGWLSCPQCIKGSRDENIPSADPSELFIGYAAPSFWQAIYPRSQEESAEEV